MDNLSVTGGIPWYIEQIQGNFNADDNIRRQCFTTSGALFHEFNKIFQEATFMRSSILESLVG